jgi:2'-5' RNA ligase
MKAGFDAEPRNFTAHLTLSRMREPGQVSELVASSRQIGAVMRVDEVVLFRSEAGGEHSRYTVVAAFPLR